MVLAFGVLIIVATIITALSSSSQGNVNTRNGSSSRNSDVRSTIGGTEDSGLYSPRPVEPNVEDDLDSAPSIPSIIRDLNDTNIVNVYINNVFEVLLVDSLSIIRAQKNDKEYIVHAEVFQMNDAYSLITDYVITYGFYDIGGWIVEHFIPESMHLITPLRGLPYHMPAEYLAQRFVQANSISLVSQNTDLVNNIDEFIFEIDNPEDLGIADGLASLSYHFNGFEWELLFEETVPISRISDEFILSLEKLSYDGVTIDYVDEIKDGVSYTALHVFFSVFSIESTCVDFYSINKTFEPKADTLEWREVNSSASHVMREWKLGEYWHASENSGIGHRYLGDRGFEIDIVSLTDSTITYSVVLKRRSESGAFSSGIVLSTTGAETVFYWKSVNWRTITGRSHILYDEHGFSFNISFPFSYYNSWSGRDVHFTEDATVFVTKDGVSMWYGFYIDAIIFSPGRLP